MVLPSWISPHARSGLRALGAGGGVEGLEEGWLGMLGWEHTGLYPAHATCNRFFCTRTKVTMIHDSYFWAIIPPLNFFVTRGWVQ